MCPPETTGDAREMGVAKSRSGRSMYHISVTYPAIMNEIPRSIVFVVVPARYASGKGGGSRNGGGVFSRYV